MIKRIGSTIPTLRSKRDRDCAVLDGDVADGAADALNPGAKLAFDGFGDLVGVDEATGGAAGMRADQPDQPILHGHAGGKGYVHAVEPEIDAGLVIVEADL